MEARGSLPWSYPGEGVHEHQRTTSREDHTARVAVRSSLPTLPVVSSITTTSPPPTHPSYQPYHQLQPQLQHQPYQNSGYLSPDTPFVDGIQHGPMNQQQQDRHQHSYLQHTAAAVPPPPPPLPHLFYSQHSPPPHHQSRQHHHHEPQQPQHQPRFRTSSTGSTRNAFYPTGNGGEHGSPYYDTGALLPVSMMMEPRFLTPGEGQERDSLRYSGGLPPPLEVWTNPSGSSNPNIRLYHNNNHNNSSNYMYHQHQHPSQQRPMRNSSEDDDLDNHHHGSPPDIKIAHQLTDESSFAVASSAKQPYERMHHPLIHDSNRMAHWYCNDAMIGKILRKLLFDPVSPEFTELQMFSMSILIGIFMGVMTAWWKRIIEGGVDFIWVTIPDILVDNNLLSVHYIWWVPTVMGGILSYVTAVCNHFLPDQNEWIVTVHSRGIPVHRDFFEWTILVVLSTMGMWSGLSLGPELPLVLTSSVVGSWLAVGSGQSVLQSRVLNLTAASAAVGGFFGFPMAGALFVLELPHRMGLQYFEALSPGIMASIVAVLANRLVTGDDVTGYFKYPFLSTTLPSSIFYCAIFYGLFGCVVGQAYAESTKFLKKLVHGWFHVPHNDPAVPEVDTDPVHASSSGNEEATPLLGKSRQTPQQTPQQPFKKKRNPWWAIAHEPSRAAVAGALAGALTGGVSIFFPHLMFWGESQLQNLIDKGRTPLPVFGQDRESAKVFTKYAMCMIDNTDEAMIQAGFGLGCSFAIAVLKMIVVGLSIGTGIVGGHFWGPLYVGCAASHWLTDMVHLLPTRMFDSLAAYPCVVILCTMGAAHVVTYRAHTAIMLILTLTITSFNPETNEGNYDVAGDYAAVFPLLVVSVFLSLHASRKTVFYPSQKERGDINAIPEALCAPGQVGAPLIVGYDLEEDDVLSSDGDSSLELPDHVVDEEIGTSNRSDSPFNSGINFADDKEAAAAAIRHEIEREFKRTATIGNSDAKPKSAAESSLGMLSSARLDALLASGGSKDGPDPAIHHNRSHRRTKSAPMSAIPELPDLPKYVNPSLKSAVNPVSSKTNRERADSNGSKSSLICVQSFGNIEETQHQPSILDQARMRSASSHRRVPSLPQAPTGPMRRSNSPSPTTRHIRSSSRERHVRMSSNASQLSHHAYDHDDELEGALSMDDIAQSFSDLVGRPIL